MFQEYMEINNYPLFYGPLEENVLKSLPKHTTLSLGYDNNLEIIRLNINNELRQLLEKTYSVGSNPSVALGKGSIQSRILDSLVIEIEKLAINKNSFSITEIGCGEGRLLEALNKNNWDITGFEIAPTSEVAESLTQNNIQIINDFYQHDKLEKSSDMIFSYGVLEHIIDLEEFFKECYKGLKEDGIFCHVVPDCEAMLLEGNIRILSHQHVNYFTKNSLINLYRKFGFSDVKYKIINPGNGLMVYGYKKQTLDSHRENLNSEEILSLFSKNLTNSLNKLDIFLNLNQDKKITFYAGGMQEYLILKREESILFTNGDSELFGKKFYMNLPEIIDPNILNSNNTDIIIIFATHYFQEIKNYILKSLNFSKNPQILSISEIIK